jgi:hypothetical protein
VRVPAAPRMKEEVRGGRIKVGGGRSVELIRGAAMVVAVANPVVATVHWRR